MATPKPRCASPSTPRNPTTRTRPPRSAPMRCPCSSARQEAESAAGLEGRLSRLAHPRRASDASVDGGAQRPRDCTRRGGGWLGETRRRLEPRGRGSCCPTRTRVSGRWPREPRADALRPRRRSRLRRRRGRPRHGEGRAQSEGHRRRARGRVLPRHHDDARSRGGRGWRRRRSLAIPNP